MSRMLPLDPKLGVDANVRLHQLWVDAAIVTRDLQKQLDDLSGLIGVTATAAELNTLDGITSSTAELNILDGVTSNATELNLLDGLAALTSGTYAPTISSVVNASSVANGADASYMRIGNMVTVSGVLTMDTNTTSLVTMLLTLPVSTTLSGYDLMGSGAAIDTAAEAVNPVAVRGNGTSTPRAQMYFKGFTGDPNASPVLYYTFSYRVA